MSLRLFIFSLLIPSIGHSSAIIDGYTNSVSCFAGDSLELYLNAASAISNYDLKLYDVRGNEVANFLMKVFPQNVRDEKPYQNGFYYSVTKKIKMPPLKSGLYLFDNIIPVIVKLRYPRIIVVYPINTENAYCNSGGKSLYTFNSSDKQQSHKVSFHRPIPYSKYCNGFLKWMQTQDFEGVGYVTDLDLDDYRTIKKSDLLIIVGHSEYWTLKARLNFDRFVSEGHNAIILSGNTMWWQVRYNKSKDQLICYRNIADDPFKDIKLKTITWSDSSLAYPVVNSIGADFGHGGYGMASARGWNGYKICSASPLLENTLLKKNEILRLQSDETDGVPVQSLNETWPVPDNTMLGFEKIELVGFDRVAKRNGSAGLATWIVFRRKPSSGIVINTGSTNWCAANGIGTNPDIQEITRNMITRLLSHENVFSVKVTEPAPGTD
jgi:hypothetical protein